MTVDNSSSCHCPPRSYCSETVSHKGKTVAKLPKYIQDICCVPENNITPTVYTPPPLTTNSLAGTVPVAPTTPTGNNECDVHYYKYPRSHCSTNSAITARAARYCSSYTTTDSTLSASLDNLNTCLYTQCTPIHANILSFGGNYLRQEPSGTLTTLKRESYEMEGQLLFKDYVNCRNTCFSNSGLSNLMDNKESELRDWVNTDMLNKYSDNFILNQTKKLTNPNTLDNNQLNSKFFYYLQYITLNQKQISKFWDNTYPANEIGHNIVSRKEISEPEQKLTMNTASLSNAQVHVGQNNLYIKFLDFVQSEGFVDLDDALVDHGNLPSHITNIPNIYCDQYEDINSCITTQLNDATCASCLSPDTLITMSDNSQKSIRDLKEGDKIISAYGKIATIEQIIPKNWKNLTLYSINNNLVKLTADHPVMTKKGWRAVDFSKSEEYGYNRYGMTNIAPLKVGDILILSDDKEIKVESIMPLDAVKDGQTFNLKLNEPHNSFYANGVLVKSHE